MTRKPFIDCLQQESLKQWGVGSQDLKYICECISRKKLLAPSAFFNPPSFFPRHPVHFSRGKISSVEVHQCLLRKEPSTIYLQGLSFKLVWKPSLIWLWLPRHRAQLAAWNILLQYLWSSVWLSVNFPNLFKVTILIIKALAQRTSRQWSTVTHWSLQGDPWTGQLALSPSSADHYYDGPQHTCAPGHEIVLEFWSELRNKKVWVAMFIPFGKNEIQTSTSFSYVLLCT